MAESKLKIKLKAIIKDDISAGCVIPGTNIVLIDLLKDDQDQVKEIRLNFGTVDIIFRFVHSVRDGTFGDYMIWVSEKQTYGRGPAVRTKLNPKDKYDAGKGVRMVSKRLICGMPKFKIKGLIYYPKDIYRAIRILVKEDKPA